MTADGVAVALETSTRAPSVAVERGAERLVTRLDGDRPHATDLMPALDELIRRLGAKPASIEAIFVGTGPGSYTGLRVGAATALGLARGTGAELLGVPSGECVAWSELDPGEEAGVLIDARGGELYFARYRRTGDDVVATVPPCVTTADELGGLLAPGVPVFADDAALAAAGRARSEAARGARWLPAVEPDAAALLALGRARLARGGGAGELSVEPLYLRAFAAKQRKR